MFDVLHGRTPANSLQTFVMPWSALEARRHGVGAQRRWAQMWRNADTKARDWKSNALTA
jgi:hypothetical protein